MGGVAPEGLSIKQTVLRKIRLRVARLRRSSGRTSFGQPRALGDRFTALDHGHIIDDRHDPQRPNIALHDPDVIPRRGGHTIGNIGDGEIVARRSPAGARLQTHG
jgi:hypothetical protein